eukprot:CAMPEP_0119278412 /NCGR_PEP_ID=MMETSP1329-20130426/19038_1 /TAXON_ID=114041 /ORGANISM="Genus nov. species nov., Strain RCC1024" /LENGTH=362 /DNA_ID=CAMNT_0007278923 /DNA_START=305 /DNA_END=1389 /DNA_ORIENTATION=-
MERWVVAILSVFAVIQLHLAYRGPPTVAAWTADDEAPQKMPWKHCAFEGANCTCESGSATYGIHESWSPRAAVPDAFACASAAFGGYRVRGPLARAVKECRCVADLPMGEVLAPACPGRRRLVGAFTFVKDEVDIIAVWVHYHASLFGYASIFVVDNYSTDGTWEVLSELKRLYGIALRRERDYRAKGDRTRALMEKHRARFDILFPLDADEFVARNGSAVSVGGACDAFDALRVHRGIDGYRVTYVHAQGAPAAAARGLLGRAPVDASKAFLSSAGPVPAKWSHGNHAGRLGKTVPTDLILIHFHKRSPAQLVKKTLNAWTGKGYPLDAGFAPDRGGAHNRQPVADILAGRVPAARELPRG